MQKDLTQEKLDWIFENIKKDSNENELLEISKLEYHTKYVGTLFKRVFGTK